MQTTTQKSLYLLYTISIALWAGQLVNQQGLVYVGGR